MSEGEKLHRLLEFIAKTGQKTYAYEELIPAYTYGIFKKPNEKEIERLCTILVNDELASHDSTKKSGGIAIKPQAIAAYYANKYFQEEEKPGYSASAILVAVIIGGVFIGGLSWLGYTVYDRGEKIKRMEERTREAEIRIKNAEVQDQKRAQQIEALSKSRDSLKNVVKSLQTQIENLKKPAAKKSTKPKPTKK